jgi:hypothetical protein
MYRALAVTADVAVVVNKITAVVCMVLDMNDRLSL